MNSLMDNKVAMLGLAVVAFLVAAVLVIMIFRMLFGGRLRMPGGRARQARLGIVDAFDLDRQRQLIIVRRDNVEHLIMIGGPNDIVIEAEIIRAEARDMRDTRREAGLAPGFGDGGRIPAPLPSLDRPDSAVDQAGPRPAEEPMLPMPLPNAANAAADQTTALPPRSPTFPLPPRRPVSPERRPAAPPKLPDSVSRGDDVPAFSGQPATPAPAPPQPVPPPPAARPPSPSQPSSPSAATPVTPAGPVGQPPAGPTDAPLQRPPFLKPSTPAPRPPIRPLQRTAPQALAPRPPGQGAPPAGVVVQAPQQSPGARPSGPPVGSTPRQSSPPATAAPPKPEEPADGLESLEEEMAKLLGRGS